MSESFLFDVFLSHSSKDKAVVRDIAERLRKDGLKVWFDEWILKPGDNIPAKIEEGLDHSCVLVLCMSVHAFGSDWAQLESGTFRFRDPLNKERRFIPLRLDDSPIKGSMAQFLYIDWLLASRVQGYAKLLEVCRPKKTEPHSVQQKELPEKVVSLGRTRSLKTVAWSPSGKRALSGSDDKTPRLWDVETGRCIRVFEGHTNRVLSVAWSPNGEEALSGSDDRTLRLWDVETGQCLRVFEGHTSGVLSVAWSSDGKWALSGSDDDTVRLWQVATGLCVREFRGDTNSIQSVAWSPNGKMVLSGSVDRTLRLWDVETGRCAQVFRGHMSSVLSVVWSSDGRRVLSGSDDTTLRLWDVKTGRCLRVFEGHTGFVNSVAFSRDGHLALSGSVDNSVRLWDVETGGCLHVLKGHKTWVTEVAWSVDDYSAFSGDLGGDIRLWDLSMFVTEARGPKASVPTEPFGPDQVQYTNAKVLLVGDTGVGKSALAERLIQKKFVQTKSSHARKAYVLESKAVSDPGSGVSVHQEIVLWDLAGQPAYRLVHQLSMEDAALACVLLDNRNETNPFEGAAYWSQVLDQARTNTKVKKVLVASRIDVGGLPASRERIESFAHAHSFNQFIPTSAYSGEGCETLLDAIRSGIPWNQLPTVTTEGPLALLRTYVGALKGEEDGGTAPPKLFTVSQLHEGFSAHCGWKISLDVFIAHLQRLEDTDAVDVLVFHSMGAKPGPETLVLLDPTRVDAYASALLVAAKDEPDGPGHLLESRIREGHFSLDREERLIDVESERHILWFVLEFLLAHDLALRERIKGNDYIIFPSQCTAELQFPGVTSFGVAFGFAGPVRNIYAVLIAQLAHFERFKKREFFHDAAAYSPDEGGRCIVRLCDQGPGKGELELSFEVDTPSAVRQGFIEFVGKLVESRSTLGSVTRRHAYQCGNKECRKPFDDAVVKVRLAARKKQLLCPYCDEKTPLVDLLVTPNIATKAVADRIDIDAKTGRRRMTAALVIKAKEAEGTFDVFLSHNSRDKAVVEKIAKRLLAVGIRPWLDKWNLPPGDTVQDALEKAVKTVSCAVLCFGPSDAGKWHIMEIRAYVEKWASGDARMIPVILPDANEMPDLPLFVRQTLWVDMRDWENSEDDSFYRLVCGILGKEPGHSPPNRFGAKEVAEWVGSKSKAKLGG